MTIPTNPSELFSPFLPTTYNIPEEEDRVKTFLLDNFSIISDIVNDKKIGVISQSSENFSGGKFFYRSTRITRNEYQVLAYIPSFPNSGVLVLTVNSDPAFPLQNVNTEFVVTNLYGTASKPPSSQGAGDGDFIGFMNEGNSNISFVMTDTTITITTTIDMTAYSGFIIINYVRNGL